MLTITSLNANGAGGKNAAPVLAYLKATEYYVDKNGQYVSSSTWWGQGADALGLSGKVDEKDMDSLARGYAPDGRSLCQNAGAAPKWVVQTDVNGVEKLDAKGNVRGRWMGGHRVGFDLTFSADKSFSVLYAAASPEERERLMDAHQSAVKDALAYVERHAETRRGQGGKEVISASLVASLHTHHGSRDLDPQIHTHALVYGVVHGADGRWGSWSNEEAYRQKMGVGALYRASLASNLQNLGYGIDKRAERDADGIETGRVYFKVAGISDELCDHFSKRRKAILAYQHEHGGSAQTACLRTRKQKDEPSYPELTDMWSQTLDAMREEKPELVPNAADLKGRTSSLGEPKDDAFILEQLHINEAVFTHAQLVERLALEHVGRLDANGVEVEAQAFLKRNDIERVSAVALHVDDRGKTLARRHTEDRFAARWMLDLEKNITQRAADRQHETGIRVDKKTVDEAVAEYEKKKGFILTAEQRRMVDWTTQETGGVAVNSGKAGTGKTATSGAWIAAFKADGRNVLGAAVGWDAAKKLEAESGIRSYSTQSLLGQLDRGKILLSPKAVIVLDEAGMAGTRTVARLQEHCDRAKAKLVLQGDALQLQAIEAGSPFRLAVSAIGERSLDEVRRQKNSGDRQTTAAFYAADGSLRSRAENQRLGLAVLKRMDKAGQIEAYASQDEAMAGLVQDHLASATPDREKLVIGSSRADVHALNLAIREGMKKRGKLGTEEHTFVTNERGVAGEVMLARGDRVRFGKKEAILGIVNGSSGVVERIASDAEGRPQIVVKLESDIAGEDGRRIVVDPKAYRSFSLGYASTVHKAQGQGKDEVRQLANLGMTDRQLSLVAFTRTKKSFALYGADEAIDPRVLAERMGTDRLKDNASEAHALRAEADKKANEERQNASLMARAVDLWKQSMAKLRGLVPVAQKPVSETIKPRRVPRLV